MDNTVIGHFPDNTSSLLYNGWNTSVPLFNPAIKPDLLCLVGGGAGSVLLDTDGLVKITDRFGKLSTIAFRRIYEGSMVAMAYKAAVARQVFMTLVAPNQTPSQIQKYGDRMELVIREYNPGEVNQNSDEKPYFAFYDSTLTPTQNLQALADTINKDPNSRVVVTLDTATVGGVANTPRLILTEKIPGRWFESVRGRRLSKPVEITSNQKQVLDGPYLNAIQAGISDQSFYAAGKQYRGLAFMYEEPITIAGAGEFRGGRSENNAHSFAKRTAWVIADLTDTDGTAKLNLLGTILSGADTPVKKYYSKGTFVTLT